MLIHGVEDELIRIERCLGQGRQHQDHERRDREKEAPAVEQGEDGLPQRPEAEGGRHRDEE